LSDKNIELLIVVQQNVLSGTVSATTSDLLCYWVHCQW